MTSCSFLFTPITLENRDARIRALFSGQDGEGQWLIDYLNGKRSRDKLNQNQRAFVEGYDALMVGLLDGNIPKNNKRLLAVDFRDAAYDYHFSTLELERLLKDKHFHDDTAVSKVQGEMGELAEQWKQFAGGVLAGLMDMERDGTRYARGEFEGLISAQALEALRSLNAQTLAAVLSSDIVEGSIGNMNSICAAYTPNGQTERCKAVSR